MPYPTIRSSTSGGLGAATSHSVTLPATVNSGDQLLVFIVANGNITFTFPGGWASEDTVSVSQFSGAIYSKAADGTEGGTSITVTVSSSDQVAWVSFALANAGAIEASAEATGGSTTPDPPNFSPSGGSGDYLMIALATSDNGASASFTGYPSTYTNTGTQQSGGSGAVRIAWATKDVTGSSENPGTFTLSGTQVWAAWTVSAAYSAPTGFTITSVTPSTFDDGRAGIIIAGAGFGASQGSSTVTIGGVTQTVTAWSNTSITITSVRGANSMGANSLRVTVV